MRAKYNYIKVAKKKKLIKIATLSPKALHLVNGITGTRVSSTDAGATSNSMNIFGIEEPRTDLITQ